MATDRFFVGFTGGEASLQTDLRPWLIADNAFEMLQNAYVFRGRVRKRFGSILSGAGQDVLKSRLAVQIGTTSGAGVLAGVVPGRIFKVGQAFSVGVVQFTVYNPAPAPQQMLRTDGLLAAATYDITNGNYNITGAPINTPVFFYPAEPVMGLTQYEIGAINNHPAFGFDTEFAYKYVGGRWLRSFTTNGLPLDIPIFHGSDSDFFWAANWKDIVSSIPIMFVTNFHIVNPNGLGIVTDDPIWAYQEIATVPTWTPFSYSPDANINFENVQPLTVTQTSPGNRSIITNYVQQARIILPFKNRLILLNTIENNANGATAYNPANHGTRIASGITPANYLTSTNTQFGARCRFSAYASPTAPNSWLEANQTYNPGGTGLLNAIGGGFVDATTDEQIIGAEFIKDRLIVYFERSTWELVSTNNQVLPFTWQKINTELGAQSTFSTVPFDKIVLGIGNTGIHACSGANVERIDNKIPDEIFDFKPDSESIKRVAGIRDYFTEMVYWAFPQVGDTPTQKFPDQVLVYNYKTGSWALNDDCFTAFGYFEQGGGLTWADLPIQWQNYNFTWSSGATAASFRQITAGTPEGFVLLLAPDNRSRNAPSMQVTNLVIGLNGYVTLTIIDHNFAPGDCLALENLTGIGLPIKGFYIVQAPIIDKDNITIIAPDIAGVYLGGGTATRVSNIQILTKRFNPYGDKDRNFYLSKADFAVQRTTNGQITVDYYPSSTDVSLVQAGIATNSIVGNNVLETFPYATVPLETQQELLWHTIYFQGEGTTVQLSMYFTTVDSLVNNVLVPAQITNGNIAWDDFELEGFILYASPTSQRLQ